MIKKVLLLISGFLLFPSLNEAQVTLTVGNGSGYKGSHNNPVSVNLSNAADKVSRVQMEVCDVDNALSVLSCDTTTRSRDGFICQVVPLPSGCARFILSSPGGLIPTGTGAIFTIRYNAATNAPTGSRALNLLNYFVYDEQSQVLTTTPGNGSFTFNSCTQASQCNDGLYCNGTDGCSSGICTHTGNPCPGTQCSTCQEATDTCFDPAGTACTDDGLYCNGDEVCNGSGSCTHAGSPCPNATCVEAQDLCTCNQLGQTCEDNIFCNGVDLCFDDGTGNNICTHLNPPCVSQGLHCAEEVDRCLCFVDAECNDANSCTDDRCETDGSCRQANNTASCDDGLFCNGADTCGCGTCNHAGDPCVSPQVCYEDTNNCATREVEVTVGTGSGVIGSLDRQVNVQLKNPSIPVGGFQIEVCDQHDYLIATSCTVSPSYAADFTCKVNEQSGCGVLLLRPSGSAAIATGSSFKTVLTVGFDVGRCITRGPACTGCGLCTNPVQKHACTGCNTPCPTCGLPCDECGPPLYQQGVTCSAGTAGCYRFDRNKLGNCNETGCYSLEDPCLPVDTGAVWLTPENLRVVDSGDNLLGALPVLPSSPNFTITCDSNADCSKGITCSTDTCSGGVCTHTPTGVQTCNDGLFCTRTDRCSGGNCTGTDDTCASVFLCDEEIDQCITCPGDADCDGVLDANDNCAGTPNGADGGSCTAGSTGSSCLEHCDCSINNGYCSRGQEDTYPPGGNNVGDACECEGNFDCDSDVDGTDANRFKSDFGRSKIVNPCTNISPCKGDFECDQDVDGSDATVFKKDFGRSQFQRPCLPCASPIWCSYP